MMGTPSDVSGILLASSSRKTVRVSNTLMDRPIFSPARGNAKKSTWEDTTSGILSYFGGGCLSLISILVDKVTITLVTTHLVLGGAGLFILHLSEISHSWSV